MSYENLVSKIIDLVGGKENIISATHCATRLRLVLKDEKKVAKDEVDQLDKVAGSVFSNGQYQIIIGLNVPDVHKEAVKQLGMNVEEENTIPKDEDTNVFNRFMKSLVKIMMPTFGVMGAAGILKGLLILATTFGWLTTDSGAYQLWYAVSQAFFYFLPIWVGISSSRAFGGNQFVGGALAAALVFPDLVALKAAGTAITFFGIPIVLVNYAQSLLPAILISFIAAKIEQFINPKLHESLRLMITPFLTLAITGPLAFLIIGPVMSKFGEILSTIVMAIYGFSPVIFGLIMGAFWQLFVVFGLHYAFIPVLINNISVHGLDPINAIFQVTVFALAGTAIGYALKSKDEKQKSIGFSTGLTGLMGITEPIIYSVALAHRRQFVYAFIGGGIAGAFQAIMKAKIYAFGNGGLFAFPLFVSPKGNLHSMYSFIIAAVIAFFVPIILTLIFGTGSKSEK